MKKLLKWFGILASTAACGVTLVSCGDAKKSVPTDTETIPVETGEQTDGQETTKNQDLAEGYYDTLDAGLKKDFAATDSSFVLTTDEGKTTITIIDAGKKTSADGSVHVVAKIYVEEYDNDDAKAKADANETYVPNSTTVMIDFDAATANLTVTSEAYDDGKTSKLLNSTYSVEILKTFIVNTFSNALQEGLKTGAYKFQEAYLSDLGITYDMIQKNVEEILGSLTAIQVNPTTVTIDLKSIVENLKLSMDGLKVVYTLDTSAYTGNVYAATKAACEFTFEDLVSAFGNETFTFEFLMDWLSQYSTKKLSEFVTSVEDITGYTYDDIVLSLNEAVATFIENAKEGLPESIYIAYFKNFEELDVDDYLLGYMVETYPACADATSFKEAVTKLDEAAAQDESGATAYLTVQKFVEDLTVNLGQMFDMDLSFLNVDAEFLKALGTQMSEQTIVEFIFNQIYAYEKNLLESEQKLKFGESLIANIVCSFKDGKAIMDLITEASKDITEFLTDGLTISFKTDLLGNPDSFSIALDYDFRDIIEALALDVNAATGAENAKVSDDDVFPTFTGALNFKFNSSVTEDWAAWKESLAAYPTLTEDMIKDAVTYVSNFDEDQLQITVVKDNDGNVTGYTYVATKEDSQIDGEDVYNCTTTFTYTAELADSYYDLSYEDGYYKFAITVGNSYTISSTYDEGYVLNPSRQDIEGYEIDTFEFYIQADTNGGFAVDEDENYTYYFDRPVEVEELEG